MKFHLGDIISISHKILISPEGIGGIYKILRYMTGTILFTHQLSRACEVCGPFLRGQYPFLNKIKIVQGEITEKNHEKWLILKTVIYGEHHEVKPLAEGEYEIRDPIMEGWEMKSADKVIPIHPHKYN